MTITRAFCAAALLATAACHPTERMESAVIRFDPISAGDAERWASSLLSDRGTIEFVGNGTVKVVDHHDNVRRVRDALARADESSYTATLRFGLILASEHGSVDVPVLDVADALRDLVRFQGFQLIGERRLSATEGHATEGRMTMAPGNDQYIVSAEIDDIRATSSRSGSVELTVRLRREHRGNLFTSSVVVPIGQTVVLGRSHPDGPHQAVLLTVRPELESAPPSRARTGARRPAPPHDHELAADTAATERAVDITRATEPARYRGARPATPPPD